MYILTRLFLQWKNKKAFETYAKGLQNENSGEFETAVINYEMAVALLTRSKFQNSALKIMITDKLKTLHTVIEYNNGYQFNRAGVNVTTKFFF